MSSTVYQTAEPSATGGNPARPQQPKPEDLRQWVNVGLLEDPRDGKLKKTPINPLTGRMARVNDPRTWATYEQACDFYADTGNPTMFAVTPDDPFAVADLDNCRNPVTGEIAPWALDAMRRLNTRTSVSSSGRGIHCLGYGTKPGTRCQHAEGRGPNGFAGGIYDQFRFIALTEDWVDGFPRDIRDCQEALNALYAELFPEPQRVGATGAIDPGALEPGADVDDFGWPKSPPMTDDHILALQATAKNADKFNRVWAGDDRDYRNDASSGDAGLLEMLAFWTQDRDQLIRLALRSDRPRKRTDKKWARPDYLRRTLDYVLSRPVTRRYGVVSAADLSPEMERLMRRMGARIAGTRLAGAR